MNPTPEPTARYEQALLRQAYGAMARFSPVRRADAIARHYVSLATLSRHLLCLTDHRLHMEESPETAELDRCIEILVRQIKEAHAGAFGIELEWGNEKTPWCEQCGQYHPDPRTAEEWRRMGCLKDRRDFEARYDNTIGA